MLPNPVFVEQFEADICFRSQFVTSGRLTKDSTYHYVKFATMPRSLAC